MKWRLLSLLLLSFLLGIDVSNYAISEQPRVTWIISNPWVISDEWVFPETLPDIKYEAGPKKTPLEKIGVPTPFPYAVAPPEAQYGTIALIVIFGGAIVLYLARPKTTGGLLAADRKKRSKKAQKRSRSINRRMKRSGSSKKDQKIKRRMKR